MRVLVLVSGQQWLGGLTIQTALLCRELEQLGHQVAVISIGADAVVDQFRHARTRHGEATADDFRDGRLRPSYSGEYVFRYEVVADAARYLPPGGLGVRNALAPVARLGTAIVTPPQTRQRAPLAQARGALSRISRAITAALDAGLSGGARESPFLARLLLNTDQHDLDRIEDIRRWFRPDVEYACDMALVPMLARLEDRGVPLVAAAQGFEIVHRRGVGLLDALRSLRHRLDLILSGSEANIEENVRGLCDIAGLDAPVRAIPYGVALDGGWELSRPAAIERLRSLERELSPEQRGDGLWGSGISEPRPPFIVTSLSRIDVEKGTDLPLHALARLRRQGVPARLWIAGNTMPTSPFLEVLRTKIRLMDLDGAVSLIGPLSDALDKVALLRASDAFVAGFIRSEPFGLVYTEAFASALPVVAPDSGAGPELMRYVGDSSTLYPENDTGAIAERLERLYRDPALHRRIAAAERRAFEERYNATVMAAAAAAEFEGAIARRAGRLHERAQALLSQGETARTADGAVPDAARSNGVHPHPDPLPTGQVTEDAGAARRGR